MSNRKIRPITGQGNISDSDEVSIMVRNRGVGKSSNVTQVGPGNIRTRGNAINLTTGTDHFIKGLRKRLPDMDDSDIEQIGNVMLERMGKYLADGDQLAVARKRKDGTVGLTIFSIEQDSAE